MDSITLKNYRCFAGEQTARLAPLTLLVGENSTGKTSFLAMVRALWDSVFKYEPPNFRESPYDLGAFEDIVHNDGSAGGKLADSFEAGFRRSQSQSENGVMSVHTTFKERQGVPFPAKRRIGGKGVWIEAQTKEYGLAIVFETSQNTWERFIGFPVSDVSFALFLAIATALDSLERIEKRETPESDGEPPLTPSELEELEKIVNALRPDFMVARRPFSSAPVRSRPRRTYDPMQQSIDSEGEYTPSYLANLYRQDFHRWHIMKDALEEFGRKSGLFDDISVKTFGDTGGAPFQIQVRKWGKRRKGPRRNLIDVGYGVSQALPLLIQLLRPDTASMFLLQEPGVHLHPSAQAALGSLFCNVAASGKQLVVETHSDYIIDRVRMDVRDGATGLKPEDVSILYFERDDLEVKIHSITIDEQGNLENCPDSYGDFFMAETRRLVGI